MSTTTSPVLDRVVDGRYQVEALLARGGMASVYQATDLRLQRPVALKVMHPDLARDDAFLARFRREARAAARLQHPHVVAVFDQGEDGDVAFLAMELVQGCTLRDVVAEHGPHSVRESLALLDPVLQALQAAHEAGLVHRDVKPENVLIHRSGAIKVADFGLARAITAGTSSRSTDLAWGTAAYLAPEQVLHGGADPRTDVYAATLLLFEVLTGRKAFPGDSPIQVAYAHVHGEVPRAGDLVPTVPAELDAVIARGTATDPEDRPADAGVLLTELRHAASQLSEDELDARPGGSSASARPELTRRFAPTTPWREDAGRYARVQGNRTARSARPTHSVPRRRRRVRAVVLAVVLLLLAGSAAGTGWYFTAGPGVHSPMPTVVGLTAEEARASLDAEQLDAVVSEQFSETVPAGVVVSADHEPGDQVRHGTDVAVSVSRGAERYEVPRLAGTTLEEARQIVEGVNLRLADPLEEHDEQVPPGQVLRVSPAPGTLARPGQEVTVVVSLGREPVEIPQVVGVAQAEAEQTLADAGLTVVVAPEQVYDDAVPQGAVLAQSPAQGSAYRGDPVTLTISRGPELVEMPSVIGSQYSEVEPQLTALGLEVVRDDYAGGLFGIVRFQSIDAGVQVPVGTEVVLTVF